MVSPRRYQAMRKTGPCEPPPSLARSTRPQRRYTSPPRLIASYLPLPFWRLEALPVESEASGAHFVVSPYTLS